MNKEQLRNEILSRVGEKRFKHILGTEKKCIRLAEIFGLPDTEAEQLSTAAVLHDITKNLSVNEHIELMSRLGKSIPKENLRGEKTLHALTGAYLARELYPEFTDDNVFDAIYCHTTGKANMKLFDKLLYLADYIEPTRTFDDCVRLREFFYRNIGKEDKLSVLDETMILSFDMTIKDLLETGRTIHPDTVSARNYLVSKGE